MQDTINWESHRFSDHQIEIRKERAANVNINHVNCGKCGMP